MTRSLPNVWGTVGTLQDMWQLSGVSNAIKHCLYSLFIFTLLWIVEAEFGTSALASQQSLHNIPQDHLIQHWLQPWPAAPQGPPRVMYPGTPQLPKVITPWVNLANTHCSPSQPTSQIAPRASRPRLPQALSAAISGHLWSPVYQAATASICSAPASQTPTGP